MTNMPAMHAFDSPQELAQTLANDVYVIVQDAILARGKASLIVSGGSTPLLFFQALRTQPIAWDKLTIIPADERWVMPGDGLSNETLVRTHLWQKGCRFISMAPQSDDESLADGAARINATLAHVDQPIDVAILGMGEDGHTASLFPHHAALENDNDNLCVAITDAPKAPAERISLSPKMLHHVRHRILHITGDAKLDTYEEAMQSGDTDTYPIAAFTKHLTTYWAA